MAKTKYGQYIKKLKFKDDTSGLYRQVTQLSGKSFGLDFHVKYGTYIAGGKMGSEPYGPHSHDFDQVMVWMGVDTNDMGKLGAEVELRRDRKIPFVSDNGNYILDCSFKSIPSAKRLEGKLNNIPGVVENGLFVNLANLVLVGTDDGLKTVK